MAVAWQYYPVKPPKSDSEVIIVKRSSAIVKIYPVQNRGKQLFMVTWFVAGKRHRRNFKNEADARREAVLVASKLSSGDAQILTLKASDRGSYLQSLRLLEPLKIPLHDAIKDYVAARGILKEEALLPAVRFYASHAQKNLPKKSVQEVLDEFLKIRKADGVSERYLEDVKSRIGRFARAFKSPIATVETGTLDEWLRSLKVSARTRKNFRILLVALFNFAKSCGYLPKQIPTVADELPTPKIESSDIEIYTVVEMRKMLNVADFNLLPILCLGGFAGLRTAESERLTWDCIKWNQGVIEIRAKASKTGQRRLTPILPPLTAFLMPIARNEGSVIGNIKIHDRMRGMAQKAEVKLKNNALRHSFASYRLAQIKNVAQLALELGNSPRMVFQHYRELVTERDAEQWWNLTPKQKGKVVPIFSKNVDVQ